MEGYSAEYEDYHQQEKNKKRTGCVIAAVIVFVLLSILLLHRMYSFLYPVLERNVSTERIEFLEAELKMDLSGIIPEKYYVVTAPDAIDNFIFYVDDYAEFMENCFFGEILSCENSGVDIFYYCETDPDDDVKMLVSFVEDDGRYCGEVKRYRVVG